MILQSLLRDPKSQTCPDYANSREERFEDAARRRLEPCSVIGDGNAYVGLPVRPPLEYTTLSPARRLTIGAQTNFANSAPKSA